MQSLFDLCPTYGAIAQYDPGLTALTGGERKRRQRLDGNVAFGSSSRDRSDLIGRQPPSDCGEVKARCRRKEFEMICEVTGNNVGEHLVPLPIDGGRAPDVAGEVTGIDETRKRCLNQGRRVPVADELRPVKGHSE